MIFGLLSRVLPDWLATLATGVWFALLVWAMFFAVIAADVNFRYWRM
jgi:hypothetical protein